MYAPIDKIYGDHTEIDADKQDEYDQAFYDDLDLICQSRIISNTLLEMASKIKEFR